MLCSSCISLSSVQSFVLDNCNGLPIENDLIKQCVLAPAVPYLYNTDSDYSLTSIADTEDLGLTVERINWCKGSAARYHCDISYLKIKDPFGVPLLTQ